MLEKNPNLRISAKDALSHPYFIAPSASMECIDEVKLKTNIQIYNICYKKSFDNIENKWLVSPGAEVLSNEESFVYYNKVAFNGNIKTVEKMGKDSNFSIKLDSSPKLQRSHSASKACRTSSETGKFLVNSCSSHFKGLPNIFEANNYIHLMAEKKKPTVENIIKIESRLLENDENQISGKSLDEKKTNGKLEEIGLNHDFEELIKGNMK